MLAEIFMLRCEAAGRSMEANTPGTKRAASEGLRRMFANTLRLLWRAFLN